MKTARYFFQLLAFATFLLLNTNIAWAEIEIIYTYDNGNMLVKQEIRSGLDSDNDGILDSDEDTNNNGTVDAGESDFYNYDTDGDTLPDGWEVANGLDPLVPNALEDSDGDGILNLQEFTIGTTANNTDSDGDGISDYDELMQGSDPNNLFSLGPPVPFVYEDAEDGTVNGWEIIDNDPVGAQILNTFDAEKQSRVITFIGAGLQNGYVLRDESGNPWHNFTDYVAKWNFKFTDFFEVHFDVQTNVGQRFIYYTGDHFSSLENNEHNLLSGGNEYIHIGLGLQNLDGRWHTVFRDLQADLHKVDPDEIISEVNGIIIRGNIIVDDIALQAGMPLFWDTDNDGILDIEEMLIFHTNPSLADSDGDGIQDGTELGFTLNSIDSATDTNSFQPDFDPTNITDPLNTDTDGDGVPDGVEDINHNGSVDIGEDDPSTATDNNITSVPNHAFSSGGGKSSSYEFVANQTLGQSIATVSITYQHKAGFWFTVESTADADTDDDGIPDHVEDSNHNGIVDPGETDPLSADTDGDGIQDGTELGYTLGDVGQDTDTSVFQPDLDPTTTTNPLNADSDGDGVSDGLEDRNHNGLVDIGESSPTAYDNEFSPASATITNIYMPMQLGNKLPYNGIDGLAGYGRYYEAVEVEEIDGVNCLKVLVKGHGNAADPEADSEWYYLWLAEDTAGVVWLFQMYSAQEDLITTYGINGAVLWMPADPIVGQLYGDTGDAYYEILESGFAVPQLSTRAGPYNECLKVRWVSGTEERILYIAPTVGVVKEEWGGGGWDFYDSTIPGPADRLPSTVMSSGGGESASNDYVAVQTLGQSLTSVGLAYQHGVGFWYTSGSATDADTDDDGIPDHVEDSNHNGIVDPGETDPLSADTDGDGIQDGTELGYTLGDVGQDTDTSVFQADLDPTTTTNPLDADSDGDGVSDGLEDRNHNGLVDIGESSPTAYDNEFSPASATITNIYMPLQQGNKLPYNGIDGLAGYGRYYEAIGVEQIDGVNCLTVLVKGHGNAADPEADSEWYYLWLAEDTAGVVWLFQMYSAQDDLITTYGINGAVLWMPADPIIGQFFGDIGTAYTEVIDRGLTVNQLNTGAGPYNDCLKVRWVSGTEERIITIAPTVGVVKEEWIIGVWELNNGSTSGPAGKVMNSVYGSGGGESSSNEYTLYQTLGQPLATVGLAYQHGGGFWYTVETPRAVKLVVDFGFEGVRAYAFLTWSLISTGNPSSMVVWNNNLITDFETDGIHSYDGSNWQLLLNENPENMTVWNNQLVLDLGTNGIATFDGQILTTISSLDPEGLYKWGNLLIIDMVTSGMMTYDGKSWKTISIFDPENVVVWNGQLVADFGADGIYKFSGNSWYEISSLDAENLAVWNGKLVVDFGIDGIQTFDGDFWNVISLADPEGLAVWNGFMMADFGAKGIDMYDGNKWTTISTDDPQGMLEW